MAKTGRTWMANGKKHRWHYNSKTVRYLQLWDYRRKKWVDTTHFHRKTRSGWRKAW